jgi:hypothetical protein
MFYVCMWTLVIAVASKYVMDCNLSVLLLCINKSVLYRHYVA